MHTVNSHVSIEEYDVAGVNLSTNNNITGQKLKLAAEGGHGNKVVVFVQSSGASGSKVYY